MGGKWFSLGLPTRETFPLPAVPVAGALGMRTQFMSLQPHAEDDHDEKDEREPPQPATSPPRLHSPHAASVDQSISSAIWVTEQRGSR